MALTVAECASSLHGQCFIGCRIDNAWVVYVPMFLIILIISLVLFLAPKVPTNPPIRTSLSPSVSSSIHLLIYLPLD